jgi:hypothetical protein
MTAGGVRHWREMSIGGVPVLGMDHVPLNSHVELPTSRQCSRRLHLEMGLERDDYSKMKSYR